MQLKSIRYHKHDKVQYMVGGLRVIGWDVSPTHADGTSWCVASSTP